jgi:predicted metal-dependent phosphotriesterase family hydrolase
VNIKWIQYLTKKNDIKKRKKFVRKQYKLVKREIHWAMKAGYFYIYYYSYLPDNIIDKLRQKGFKVEKIKDCYCEKWYINWEI